MMFISGRSKDEYLTGTATEPDPTSAESIVWRAENNLVMSWLISSMTTEIGENFLYTTAKEIWEAVHETFSSSDNTAELFYVESTLQDLHQVRGRILGTKVLPSLREAFSEVRREESHKRVMLGQSNPVVPKTPALAAVQNTQHDSSALAARNSRHDNDNRTRKGRPWCDHCRKPGHLKETCW
ncbi:uncharacterized protein LOC133819015 [Humulus lupulus]|uniref:uncharacterized protein LOC133819015 n=1 Tax=Humulus lupulus TaxID=3486 RepID=UPI002B400B9D|nr:uncharacterized protein LOC133819015 [Humulus lupulus]